MSLKNTVRKIIAGVMTAAAVSYLAGCAANEAPDGDPQISDVSSAETVGSSAPDTEDSGADVTVDTPIVTDDAEPEDKAPAVPAQSAEAAAPVSSEASWSTDADNADNEETAEPEPEVDPADLYPTVVDTTVVEQEWTETPASGTYYVNTDYVNARKKPIQGADSKKVYFVNDEVTVTAITDTEYYKLSDGSFMHQDFLSSSKVSKPASVDLPANETPNTGSSGNSSPSGDSGSNGGSSSSGTPKNGDTKVENGKTYIYNEIFGWCEDEGPGGTVGDDSDITIRDTPIVGHM